MRERERVKKKRCADGSCSGEKIASGAFTLRDRGVGIRAYVCLFRRGIMVIVEEGGLHN